MLPQVRAQRHGREADRREACRHGDDALHRRPSQQVVRAGWEYISEAPQGNERGALGSKNPPAYWNPCFSLPSMVQNLGFVLRPVSPYAIASLGVA